jgi:hypothetical protein
MVEFAITVSLFLLLTLAIMEFVLLIFDMSRANEMTRQLSRLAITADPVCDIWESDCSGSGAPGLSCDPSSLPGDSAVIVDLGEVDILGPSNSSPLGTTGYRMLNLAQDFLPAVEAENVQVSYYCSNTGSVDRPQPIPLVAVRLENFSRPFIIGSFLGLSTGTQRVYSEHGKS